MKTRNFPGRKQQRRTSALSRLEKTKRFDSAKIHELVEPEKPNALKEQKILIERIEKGGKKKTKKSRVGHIARNKSFGGF